MSEKMTTLTVVLSTDPDSIVTKRTVASCQADGVRVIVRDPEKLPHAIEEAAEEFVHITRDGMVFLPAFYTAMLTALEHSGRDYALVHSFGVDGDETYVRKGDGALLPGQMVVRRWVLKERGVQSGGFDSFVRLIADEYQGIEVPHVLIVESEK